jgi:hypothetical protein
MVEALIGTLFGGLFRLAPEILKWLDKKDERRHELSMMEYQLKADELRGQIAIDTINAQVEGQIGIAEVDAIIEATKAQATKTGVRWVDGLNSLMRPLITFWWVIVLYSTSMGVQYYLLLQNEFSAGTSFLMVFGADEKAIAASIISFWFVDRSLRKRFGR